jgi:hypothetical protein
VRGARSTWALAAIAAAIGLMAPAAASARKAATSTVETVSPASGPATGGNTVTINGSGFTPATQVYFGAVPATGFSVISDTEIQATAPAQAPAKVKVAVETPLGLGRSKGGAKYKVTPIVTSVSPGEGAAAGGTPVTIDGAGFAPGTSATEIRFGGSRASSIECASTTECTARSPVIRAPGEAGPVNVRVKVNRIESPKTPADLFTYHAVLLLNGSEEKDLAGTRLTLRSVVDGAEAICFPHAPGVITANRGEPEISTGTAAEFGSCERSDFFGDLPSGYDVHIDASGGVTITGEMGVRDPNGCVYEGSSMTGGLEESKFLALHAEGTFKNVPTPAEEEHLEQLRSELHQAEAELETVEREISETEGEEGAEAEAHLEQLRERRELLRARVSQLEGEIEEAETKCFSFRVIGVTLEDELVLVRRLGA